LKPSKHLHEALNILKLNKELAKKTSKHKARFIIDIDPYNMI